MDIKVITVVLEPLERHNSEELFLPRELGQVYKLLLLLAKLLELVILVDQKKVVLPLVALDL